MSGQTLKLILHIQSCRMASTTIITTSTLRKFAIRPHMVGTVIPCLRGQQKRVILEHKAVSKPAYQRLYASQKRQVFRHLQEVVGVVPNVWGRVFDAPIERFRGALLAWTAARSIVRLDCHVFSAGACHDSVLSGKRE